MDKWMYEWMNEFDVDFLLFALLHRILLNNEWTNEWLNDYYDDKFYNFGFYSHWKKANGANYKGNYKWKLVFLVYFKANICTKHPKKTNIEKLNDIE